MRRRFSHLSFLLLVVLLSVPAIQNASAGGDITSAEEWKPSADGYVLVSSATWTGWLALPAEEDVLWPLPQTLADGTETFNLLHLTPEGVCIEEADCSNQDCVNQGLVTFDNRSERVLGNMIICLPNQVILQLYTSEEVQELVQRGMPAPEE